MSLHASVKLVIICLFLNLSIALIRIFYPSLTSFQQNSIWLKQFMSFLWLLQTLLLYVPLIVFFVTLYSELSRSSEQGRNTVEVFSETTTQTPEKTMSSSQGTGGVIRRILLVVLFTIIGVIGILISWVILYAVSDSVISKDMALPFIQGLTVITPILLWGITFFLTRHVQPPLQQDIRLFSAIGLFLAVGIAWVGLAPFAMLGIGFKGVRM